MFAVVGSLCLATTSVFAESYRWKDKDGKTHYGATIPAEYADQPYDVLNSAGLVIEHVEDTRESVGERKERLAQKEEDEKDTLTSDEQRQIQSDRLLVLQYQSEEEITHALELEIAQLGYDSKILHQSHDAATIAIRDQIRLAADQQRAGQTVDQAQQNKINKLYRRLARDEKRIAALDSRETKIRARFQSDLTRYQRITAEEQERDEEQADQG